MLRRITRDAFPLKGGEWRLGLFLYALLTLMVAADWVGKLGADSLFVKRWGVNYVPVMYIVTPAVMLAVSAMIFFFVDRVRRRTLLLWYVAGVTLLSVAIQAGVTFQGQLPNGWLVQPISYVFAHGVKETIYILFWVYAGNLYDAGQSKRLFPFFAGSVLVGKILGGAIGAGVAPLIHAENFIGAQAVGFLVCFVALVIYRGLPEGHGSRVEEERPKGFAASVRDSAEGYRAVVSDKMLRTFGAGVFFWYFLMQFGNFLYPVGLDQSASGGVNAFGNFAAAVALLVGLQLRDNQLLLAVATGLSGVYLYNAWHMMRLFGRRILANLSSIEPDVRFGAAEILATEHGTVSDKLLRSLDGTIPADVEHGVRVALTRRGVLAVAADATE